MLVGADWSVLLRGGNRFVIHRLCMGCGSDWLYLGQRGELATLALMLHQGRNRGG